MSHVLKVKSIKLYVAGPHSWVTILVGKKQEMHLLKEGIADWDSKEKDHIHIQPENLLHKPHELEVNIVDEKSLQHANNKNYKLSDKELEKHCVIDLSMLAELLENGIPTRSNKHKLQQLLDSKVSEPAAKMPSKKKKASGGREPDAS